MRSMGVFGLQKVNFVAFCFGAISTLFFCLLLFSAQNSTNKGVIQLRASQEYTRNSFWAPGVEIHKNLTETNIIRHGSKSDVLHFDEPIQTSTSHPTERTTSVLGPTCPSPGQRNIVCIKVHKAASTTAVAILERYGYKNNMTLAVKAETKYGPHILSSSQQFKRNMVYQYQRKYNMLTNHVRYNRAEMDIVIPNATYLTILRHPVKHFESAFVYFLVAKHLNLNGTDKIEAFFEKPDMYLSQKFYFWYQLQSGQIFDLGLDHHDHTGPKVAMLIQRLAEEFDLVMIADYFDESLVLLRKHLCLDWKDVVYIPDNFRTSGQKLSISRELRQKIEIWNWADMTLYRFFNHTFWNKVNDYGPTFKQDLAYFRKLLEDTRNECTTGKVIKKRRDAHGVRTIELRKNATEFCTNLMLGDTDYTKMFRNRQKETLYNRPQFWHN
ncbi:galactosylceramide sulfotransferase-like [Amphiura filiformis]|uniref:galactosylceramide sulfotransferase-like n=1 Tax=Amphiura filiformis TaxID=82378 RepID=UPI003B21E572